jgi:hypothetical protein
MKKDLQNAFDRDERQAEIVFREDNLHDTWELSTEVGPRQNDGFQCGPIALVDCGCQALGSKSINYTLDPNLLIGIRCWIMHEMCVELEESANTVVTHSSRKNDSE